MEQFLISKNQTFDFNMAESSTIMGLVGAFIAIAIMLSIGIQILGNVQNGTPCSTMPGFNSTGSTSGTGPFGSAPGTGAAAGNPVSTFKYSSWALQCLSNNSSQQSAYTLLGVILIVVAAVAILFVVRLL